MSGFGKSIEFFGKACQEVQIALLGLKDIGVRMCLKLGIQFEFQVMFFGKFQKNVFEEKRLGSFPSCGLAAVRPCTGFFLFQGLSHSRGSGTVRQMGYAKEFDFIDGIDARGKNKCLCGIGWDF